MSHPRPTPPPRIARVRAGVRAVGAAITLPVILVWLAVGRPMLNSASAAAGHAVRPHAAQLQLAIDKLAVVGSVLYVAAHPDDENTNLLAYLSNGALLRTGYLSITRGDGGQNLIGSEQGPELGLIRTQELLAARRIDGAEQFFTRARDFGFSKNPQETLRIWGKQAVLGDVVWVIRRFRPDVIITRFSPDPSDTHGHHTASAILALDAFQAAADPHAFPDQLRDGVTTWQPRRLLWNRSTWSARPNEDFSGFDRVDVGGYNSLLGASYGEIAADSRSMHKSQGFGVAPTRSGIIEYFRTLKHVEPTAAGPPSWLNGIDFSWRRWRKTEAVVSAIEAARRQFKAADPAAAIPALLAVDAALDGVADAQWRAQKKLEVRDLIGGCAGLFLDATASDHRVAPDATIEVTATALNRSSAPITLRQLRFRAGPSSDEVVAVGQQLLARPATPPTTTGAAKASAPLEIRRAVVVPAGTPPSTPYWLSAPPQPGLYPAPAPRLIGLPEDQPELAVDFELQVGGGGASRAFLFTRPVSFKWTDPVAGERYRPVEVTPTVSVRPDSKLLLFPERAQTGKSLTVRLLAGAPGVRGVLRAQVPAGWSVQPASEPFAIEAKGQEKELTFKVHRAGRAVVTPPPAEGAAASSAGSPDSSQAGRLQFVAELSAPAGSGGGRPSPSGPLSTGVVQLAHPHIPVQTWLAPAEVQLVALALETGGTNIGYIPGPGDEVPASLRRVGYRVSMLNDDALRAGRPSLAPFDAIVVGVRAFNTSERLRSAHHALMKYVEAGGVLVVQYNTNSRIGPLPVPIGPFPLEIGRDRVTDETAAVTFVLPNHPALTRPNRLSSRDFEGWVQERGLYFAAKWDTRYEAVLALHDPGEKPLAGGLLVARHGKGTFVYTGLSFFRQLPAGVPGAFRLFANLLAGGAKGGGRSRTAAATAATPAPHVDAR